MREAERFLREHWHATKQIGRLMLDLSLARSAMKKAMIVRFRAASTSQLRPNNEVI